MVWNDFLLILLLKFFSNHSILFILCFSIHRLFKHWVGGNKSEITLSWVAEQQVMRGHNIISDGWAGASNPHPHPMPPQQHAYPKKQLKRSFFHFSTRGLRTDGRTDKASYRVACPQLKSGKTSASEAFCVCLYVSGGWGGGWGVDGGWMPLPTRPQRYHLD